MGWVEGWSEYHNLQQKVTQEVDQEKSIYPAHLRTEVESLGSSSSYDGRGSQQPEVDVGSQWPAPWHANNVNNMHTLPTSPRQVVPAGTIFTTSIAVPRLIVQDTAQVASKVGSGPV